VNELILWNKFIRNRKKREAALKTYISGKVLKISIMDNEQIRFYFGI
jgi:hypothetical protein